MTCVCDFCYDPKPVWSYESEDVSLGVISNTGAEVVVSKGAWAACELCRALIDAGEWAGLLGRSVRGFDLEFGYLRLPPLDVSRIIASAHEAFRRARRGITAAPLEPSASLT